MKRAATAIAAVFLCLLACATADAQSVVVNKYFNSGTTADIVELLVIQDALDMRGMYLKDFSSNMANDGGGKYQCSNDALWSAVPAGTLIVLRNNNSAADVSAATSGSRRQPTGCSPRPTPRRAASSCPGSTRRSASCRA